MFECFHILTTHGLWLWNGESKKKTLFKCSVLNGQYVISAAWDLSVTDRLFPSLKWLPAFCTIKASYWKRSFEEQGRTSIDAAAAAAMHVNKNVRLQNVRKQTQLKWEFKFLLSSNTVWWQRFLHFPQHQKAFLLNMKHLPHLSVSGTIIVMRKDNLQKSHMFKTKPELNDKRHLIIYNLIVLIRTSLWRLFLMLRVLPETKLDAAV